LRGILLLLKCNAALAPASKRCNDLFGLKALPMTEMATPLG
jgi:hypothetical protein